MSIRVFALAVSSARALAAALGHRGLAHRGVAVAGVCTVLAMAAGSASATVVIGNLPPTDDSLSAGLSAPASSRRAAVFTMGSTAYSVDDVVFRLSGYNTTTGDTENVGFFLDNGLGTNVGAQVGSFLINPSSGSDLVNSFTFTPSGSLTLAANTKYWLVVTPTAGSSFSWHGSSPSITPTGLGATFGSIQGSFNNGTTYSSSTSLSSFQIDGTALPAPGSAAALVLGGGMLLHRRRRIVARAVRSSSRR